MDKQDEFPKMTRREFLVAASASLAMLAGCRLRRVTPEAFVATAVPGALPTQPPALTGSATRILTNAKVLTMDAAGSAHEAVAIQGGRILAVGKVREIAAHAGPETEIIDVEGRVITPGMIDPHIHVRVLGLNQSYYRPFMPPDVKDVPTMQQKLAENIAALPPGSWIVGYYLILQDVAIPTRWDLDAVSPDHPVFIMHIGGHWGTGNSLAMQMAGITDSTPSPEGGYIEKDESGRLTGVFYNHRAMDVLRRVIPPSTEKEVMDGLHNTLPMLAACGVTSFQDNNVRSPEQIANYQQLEAMGNMLIRGAVYYTLEWPKDLETALAIQPFQSDLLKFAGFKFLIDGQSPSAFTREPHNGAVWNISTWEAGNFKETVRQLHDTGLQICTHCCGDAAASLALDAYEGAMLANPRPDPRHRLEHIVISTTEETSRMKALNVVASTNPQFIYMAGDAWEGIFGAERINRAMVTREWVDAGIPVTIGSDAPSTPWYTPQVDLIGTVLRRTYSGRVINEDQCLTMDEALRAHTIQAAYACHEESIKGSIEAGKLADLAVWNLDPTRSKAADIINNTTMFMTLVNGEIVFQV